MSGWGTGLLTNLYNTFILKADPTALCGKEEYRQKIEMGEEEEAW